MQVKCYARKEKNKNEVKKWRKNQKGVVGWSYLKGVWKSSNSLVESVSLKTKSSFEELDVSKTGRPNCLSDEKRERLLNEYFTHPYSLRQLADMFGVSRMTVWRAVQCAFQ